MTYWDMPYYKNTYVKIKPTIVPKKPNTSL